MEDIEKIADALYTFDLILLIIDGDGAAKNLTADFCQSEALKQTSKKVLILSQVDIFCRNHGNWKYCQISDMEQSALCDLYRMYEFSNRFQVLSDALQYGGILNYLKTGRMTREEIFQSVLDEGVK